MNASQIAELILASVAGIIYVNFAIDLDHEELIYIPLVFVGAWLSYVGYTNHADQVRNMGFLVGVVMLVAAIIVVHQNTKPHRERRKLLEMTVRDAIAHDLLRVISPDSRECVIERFGDLRVGEVIKIFAQHKNDEHLVASKHFRIQSPDLATTAMHMMLANQGLLRKTGLSKIGA